MSTIHRSTYDVGMSMQTSPLLSEFQAREPSSIFPPALPLNYAFLSSPSIGKRVNIKHPGYDEEDEDLFSLYAWDHVDGGLHFGFVLDACRMISGHQPGGYLSTRRGGPPIQGDECALLRAGNYYFHIPAPGDDAETATSPAPYRWPVVACFRDWSFPKTLPDRWAKNYLTENISFTSQQSTVTGAVRGRDRTCRVSDYSTGTQRAHLVPQHEADWFNRNSMSKFNADLTLDPDHLLDDLGNSTLLRSDIHTGFDERRLIFYPKAENGFVVHMLEPTPDLAQLYHNVPVQSPFNCHPSFLYARMAWAIFPSLAGFWSKPGVKRAALLYKNTENSRGLFEKEIVNGTDIQARIAKSRSSSPRKKKRGVPEDDEGEDIYRAGKRSRTPSDTRAAQENVSLSTASWGTQSQTHPEQDDAVSDSSVLSEPLEDPRLRSGEHGRSSVDTKMLCPSWYKGYSKIEQMRQDWLWLERKRNERAAGGLEAAS